MEKAELSVVERVALAKADAKLAKAASGELQPGTYKGEVAVVVSYNLNKGEDYEQDIWQETKPEAVLAVALSKLNGVTVEAIVREAMNADPAKVKAIKKQADDAIKALRAHNGKKVCNGKVTGSATVVKAIVL